MNIYQVITPIRSEKQCFSKVNLKKKATNIGVHTLFTESSPRTSTITTGHAALFMGLDCLCHFLCFLQIFHNSIFVLHSITWQFRWAQDSNSVVSWLWLSNVIMSRLIKILSIINSKHCVHSFVIWLEWMSIQCLYLDKLNVSIHDSPIIFSLLFFFKLIHQLINKL